MLSQPSVTQDASPVSLPVHGAFSSLFASISYLSNAVSAFEDRIGPVLGPASCKAGVDSNAAPVPEKSQIAHQTDAAANDVERLAGRLYALISRLEV